MSLFSDGNANYIKNEHFVSKPFFMMKSQDPSFLLISFREVLVKFWTIIMAMYFLELQTAVLA